ncbi:hypothetical protein JW906_03660 [bacterium]|nr:hypothetical protein [bacterium]
MKNELATKADLSKTSKGLHQEIAGVKSDLKTTAKGLHQEIAAVKTELHQEIVSVKTELHREITAVRTELHQEIAGLRTELHQEISGLRTELHQEIAAVKKDIEIVAVQVVQVSNDLKEFKQETHERFDGVMTAIDGLAGLITNGQTEQAAVYHALQRHDLKLDDHETRIGVLEQKN